MKVRVSLALTVAGAVRMARGLGCDLRFENGQAYLVRREPPPKDRPDNKEAPHARQTDT